MANVPDVPSANHPQDSDQLGAELSRDLTPTSLERIGDVAPLSRFLDFCLGDLPSIAGDRTESEVRDLANTAEQAIRIKATAGMATGKLDAFVRADDGALFRIPPAYWRDKHSFRPLAGEGFYAEKSHGPLAESLDGRAIYIDEEQLRKFAAEFQVDVIAKESKRRRKTNKEPAWLPALRQEMEDRDRDNSKKRMAGKPEPRWPRSPFFRDRLIKGRGFPESVAKSTVRFWVARINEELGR